MLADQEIKQQAEDAHDAGSLPDAGTVIFDEAHDLEDVASSYFGITVSNARVEELCRDVEASLQRNHLLSASVSGALKSLRERAMFFFALLRSEEHTSELQSLAYLVCRLLLEKKKTMIHHVH